MKFALFALFADHHWYWNYVQLLFDCWLVMYFCWAGWLIGYFFKFVQNTHNTYIYIKISHRPRRHSLATIQFCSWQSLHTYTLTHNQYNMRMFLFSLLLFCLLVVLLFLLLFFSVCTNKNLQMICYDGRSTEIKFRLIPLLL